MNRRLTDLGWLRLARVLANAARSRTFLAAKAALVRTEESLPAAFAPDAYLPVQYYEALRHKHLLEGEKLLMFAVLEDAVETYMKYLNVPTRRAQNRFREAEEWIESHDRLWLFSFDNCCDAVNIDPDYMRQGLHRWKARELDKAGHAASP